MMIERGSKRGYLNNAYCFIFWFSNMKQLNFNTNRKKFTVTVVFFFRKKQNGLQKANMLCFVHHGAFCHFPTIPDYCQISEDHRRVAKIFESYRRCQKIAKDFQEEIREFWTSSLSLYSYGKEILLEVKDSIFFQGEKSLLTYVITEYFFII